ncbi:MAG: histidine phosphatase family protein [Alphaproteobacteria bacterium]|nr:histidine phosphatase family protein [Alphaproteobacteria bacterium]
MSSIIRVHLVRHVPVINLGQIWYGRDIPFDTTSDRVKSYFNQLAQALPHDPGKSLWLSSPYPRAVATAEGVISAIKHQENCALALHQDEGFIEQQYGVMEDMKHEEVKQCAGAADYLSDMWNKPPQDGESMQMLQNRVADSLDRIRKTAPEGCEDAVVFTHGGVIMAAYAHARGKRMIDVFKDKKSSLTPSFSYISCLTISADRKSGQWTWNDQYLKGIGKEPS